MKEKLVPKHVEVSRVDDDVFANDQGYLTASVVAVFWTSIWALASESVSVLSQAVYILEVLQQKLLFVQV